VPFRVAFDCLWCGRAWQTREPTDLEGWASLCPDCLGRAQDNSFLRFRLRAALQGRAQSAAIAEAGGLPRATAQADPDLDMRAYYAARASEYDDWYTRRGRYSRGPVRDLAWQTELDQATQWLDRQPLQGEIVELAAGTGWWSPLLAQKGELSVYDINPEPLELARERLIAHGLRAHIHVQDAWAEPDRQVDGLFCGFWLSHVRAHRLADFLDLVARWLRPGGRLGFIDSRPDPEAGAVDHDPVTHDGVSLRRLADGREYRVPKIHHRPEELAMALLEAGFSDVEVGATARFFVLGGASR
jgi:demethylmenaquinone methyltransferase/2-methoxy-6-polyprenyl-1,4-benzoquinol methylase